MILVFVEHAEGDVLLTSREAMTFGRGLAAELGVPLHAAFVGGEPAPLALACGTYGADVVHAVGGATSDTYAPVAWARALAGIAGSARAVAVVASGTDRGAEVLAHLGAITDLPLAAGCVSATPGDPFRVTRQRYGGSLLEDATIDGAIKLLGMAPHAVAAEEAASPSTPEVRPFEPVLEEADVRVRLTDRELAEPGSISLADARVVVGGGRGVGGAEGFKPLEELARRLGGTVGVSRAVTSAGWRPHSEQVGQTGARIAPDLYIACGISGATQHIVGCRGAKRILAINTDRDAPMVTAADYAVIGDLHEVIAAVLAELP